MSDSEEDFASADEGDIHPNSGGVSKGQKEKSSTNTKKDAKEDEKENKAVGKSKSVKTETKNDSLAEDSKETQNKEKSKSSEKSKAGPSKKESGKDGKSGTQDEKSKEKPKGGKGKKGKQKVGKGKNDHSVKEAGGNDIDEGIDNKKTELATKSDASSGKETDNISEAKSGESKDKEIVEQDSKSETYSSQAITSEENVKETKAQPGADVTGTPGKEASSDSQENLTLEEKVALIKSPSSQSIIRPAPDHTDKEEAVLEKLAGAAQEKKSGWGWGWGSSLLEVASSSVSTFTSQVGEGLHTMMETVESTLNVPDPEELAQKVAKQTEASQEQDGDNKDGAPRESEKQSDQSSGFENQPMSEETVKQTKQSESTETQSTEAETKADNQSGDGWFSAWGVSNITKMVESTGKNLVTGSLDVLETLGKKTFDVINEHDPGLKKARAFLHDRGDKPNLSAMLRDAKEQYETQVELEKESEEARKAHFGSLFDDFQGLAHLEALEMLSNQSEKKVNALLNALPAETIAKLKPQLLEIKQNFEIDEDEEEVTEQEFTLLVTELLKELNVGTTPNKILKTYDGIEEKLKECSDAESNSDVKEIHRVAISSLAELTSKCIEQFHKAGELILIQKSTVSVFSSCSSTLLRLTKVLTAEVGILSTKFSDCLNKHEGDEIKVSHLVTNIYLEASNSSSYIQDGFRLLLPVLQQAAIERSQEPED